MAATGLLLPNIQLFDDDGNPVAGGFLYSYEAGSSTPQDTFNNADLDPAHANTNPIELDSSGRAIVYLSPTPAYKFVLKTSALVELWTQDDVSPAAVAS